MFETGTLLDLGQHLVGVDMHTFSDDELLSGSIDLERLISLAQTAQAHVLAELDVRGVTDREHGMKTVSWVARETGSARGQIRSRLKVGRSLRHHFDRVDDAVADGRLNYDHAKCLSDADNPRITEVLAAAQDEMIALAEASTFEQWKRDVLALAEYADTDGAEPDPYAHNELHLSKTLDGHTDVSGSFDAVHGLSIRTAIEAKADELFRRFSHDRELTPDLAIPPRKVLRALALAELLREAVGAEPGTGVAPRAEVTLVVHDGEVTDPDGTPVPRAAADV
jgi:hypothetical protein